jgi:tetratricopeptide (TPR) repeat protein
VSDYAQAEKLAQEALYIRSELKDQWDITFLLYSAADVKLERSKTAEARSLAEEWLDISRHLQDLPSCSNALFYLANIALTQGDLLQAQAMLEESWSAVSKHDGSDRWDKSILMNIQGAIACYQGDYDRAETLCGDALTLFQATGFKHGTATALHSLGDIALLQGDTAQAKPLFEEGLLLFRENGNKQRSTWCLTGLAAVAAMDGQTGRAITLWAAAEAIRASIGNPRPALRHKEYCEWVNAVRPRLDERVLHAAAAAGRAMTLDQAVDCVLMGE